MVDGNPRAKNLSYLRSSNQGAVIRTLLTSDRVSRGDLGEGTGLTKMSITNLVGDLMEKGIVREEPFDDAGQSGVPGRRPMQLRLCGGKVFALGVYLSRGWVCSAVVDLLGTVRDQLVEELPASTTRESLGGVVIRHLRALMERHGALRILGIGVASVGMVDMGSGTLVSSTDFYGIEDWNIRELLKGFGMPVYVVNDMKGCALAELFWGEARRFTDFVYLGVTNGIGAGVVVGSRLLEGKEGFSGEIGHTCIQRDGPRCGCGNVGCLELYASVPRLLERSGHQSWNALLEAAEAGDTASDAVLLGCCRDIGVTLTSIANVLDPQAIVIGHEGAELPERYLALLQKGLDGTAMTRAVKRVEVARSALGGSISRLGAGAAVFHQLFLGRVQV